VLVENENWSEQVSGLCGYPKIE